MQASVERMLLDRVDNLPPKVSMAVLVMDNDSLEIKAYAGSADFSDDSRYAHVDMVRGVRSPGSTLKPFLYAQALDEGLIHSESLLIDAPLSSRRLRAGQFPGRFLGADQRGPGAAAVPECPGRGPAGPRRAGQFRLGYAGGRVRLRLAGADPNLSLILGGGGTTLEELVGAYRRWRAAACRGVPGCGRSSPGGVPYDERRSRLDCPGHPGKRRPPTARSMNRAIRAAAGLEDRHQFRFPRCLVGRRDRQMDDRRVGRSSGRHAQSGLFGANVAAPLLQDIVAALPEGAPQPRIRPATVQAVVTCWPLGYRLGSGPTEACPEQRAAWALNDTVPPSFAGYADVTQGPLRLGGVSAGRCGACRAAGRWRWTWTRRAPKVVWWMLDGRVVNHGAAAHPFKLVLARDGRYTLTVMDTKGRHDSVVLKSLVLRHDRHRI